MVRPLHSHCRELASRPFKLAMGLLRPLKQTLLDPWKTRVLLRELCRRDARQASRRAVIGGAIDYTIMDCSNDFELVARASKELEYLLVTYFDAPSGKGVTLGVKMRAARTCDGKPLRTELLKHMKHFLKTRNSLLHKRDVNVIRLRRDFLSSLEEVLYELALEMKRVQQRRSGLNALPTGHRVDNVTSTAARTAFVIRMPLQLPAPVRIRLGGQRRSRDSSDDEYCA